jgi:soluble lytic murein transglycosylase
VSAPALVATCLLLAAPPPPTTAPAAPREFWLPSSPESPEEKALAEALAKGNGFSGPTASIPGLEQVTAAFPATAASGLAQLAAGLILVDANRAAEAIPFLTHPDVQQTLLFGHALVALGRAQETLRQMRAAGHSYLAAAGSAEPLGPLSCDALGRAAEAFTKAGDPLLAAASLERALGGCAGQEPRFLLALAKTRDGAGHFEAAALAYDTLDRDHPASSQAKEGAARLAALGALRPALPPQERAARDLAKGLRLFDARRHRDAVAALRAYLALNPRGEEADLARVRLGRALLALRKTAEARRTLAAVAPDSPHAAEAAFYAAKIRAARGPVEDAYGPVVRKHAGTPWAEEALLSLANNYQKDARDEEALPHWRRLLAAYPDGRYVERAAWRVAWADYRARRFTSAAETLERVARLRIETWATPGFLYWAARSRAALGQADRARQLYEETVRRFKYAYHGLRARDALARLPRRTAPAAVASLAPLDPAPADDVPEPTRTRVRQLLLIGRLAEASTELRPFESSPKARATVAWTLFRRGQLRPAIVAMKRAYPQWVSEAGDRLPDEVWRILFPIQFKDALSAKAAAEGLDPALLAALILQESSFDPQALSRAGARGLMQVIPATGRKLARDMRVPFRRASLHDPKTSLDFGTLYLRQMMERYDGRPERMLAAYNAGPHRVDAWTLLRPGQSAEEFVESIPFTETRAYVMLILAAREHYRRLYGLVPVSPPPVEGRRP